MNIFKKVRKAGIIAVLALVLSVAGMTATSPVASAASTDPTYVRNSSKSSNVLMIYTEDGVASYVAVGQTITAPPGKHFVTFFLNPDRNIVVCDKDDKNNNCVNRLQVANATGFHNFVNRITVTVHVLREK